MRVLRTATAEWAMIAPKVSLGDLFYAKTSDRSQNQVYKNKIDRKHVDFLLCDPKTLRPILGIELDDKSHQREDRQERDNFVNGVFAAAGLPIARVPVRRSYQTNQLNQFLQQRAGIAPSEAGSGPELATEIAIKPDTPNCPKCGSQMALRTAKRGSNKGSQFWGCSEYPKCRGIKTYVIREG